MSTNTIQRIVLIGASSLFTLSLLGLLFLAYSPRAFGDLVTERWLEYHLNSQLKQRGYQPIWETREQLSLIEHAFLLHHITKYQPGPHEWKEKPKDSVIYLLKSENMVFVFTGPEVTTEKLALPDLKDPKAARLEVEIFPRGAIPNAAWVFPFVQPKEFERFIDRTDLVLQTVGYTATGAIFAVWIVMPELLPRLERVRAKRKLAASQKARKERRLAAKAAKEAAKQPPRIFASPITTPQVSSGPNLEKQLGSLRLELEHHAESQNPDIQEAAREALEKIKGTSLARGLRIATHVLKDIAGLRTNQNQGLEEYTPSTPGENGGKTLATANRPKHVPLEWCQNRRRSDVILGFTREGWAKRTGDHVVLTKGNQMVIFRGHGEQLTPHTLRKKLYDARIAKDEARRILGIGGA